MSNAKSRLLVCGIRIKDSPEKRIACQQPMHHSGLHLTATILVADDVPHHEQGLEVTLNMLPRSIRDIIGGRPYEIVNVQVHQAA